jgi:hypothetical protein
VGDWDVDEFGDFVQGFDEFDGDASGCRTDIGANEVAGPGLGVIELAVDLDQICGNANFLVSLAKRGGFEVCVLGITSATGKGNFTFVVSDGLGALLEDEMVFISVFVEEEEDSGGAEVAELKLVGLVVGKGLTNLVPEHGISRR